MAGINSWSGIGADQFQHPFCVTLDSSNTLYVSDQPNNRVQKWLVNASAGTTVAGQADGTIGSALDYLCYPSDLAVDSSDGLYVVDGGNHRVVYWPYGASSGTLMAGTGRKPYEND